MSFNERQPRLRMQATPSRSQSFSGYHPPPPVSPGSPASPSPSGGSSSSASSPYSAPVMSPGGPRSSPQEAPWGTPVLGDMCRPARQTRPGLRRAQSALGTSFKKAGIKLPKVPRPHRTMIIFQSIKRGLRECILATEDDISCLRSSEEMNTTSSTGQARILDIEKQVKAAERYQKRLEFHLTKIEELEEQYFLHQQLREGVKNMARAFVSHTGEHKRESLSNVKCGFKECTQILCAIEGQLENLMGKFHFQTKGLLGFARLMPGDVYEIAVRHGEQKWKSRGRIGASTQSWDNDTSVFKALLGEMLDVKVAEVKMLGKQAMLGQKKCDTKDLFSSHPQMMTVSINPQGTIKLSILVTWNPLEGIEEALHVFEPVVLRPQATPRRPRNVQSMVEGYHFAYTNGRGGSLSSEGSDLSRSPSAAGSSAGSTSPTASTPRYFRHSVAVFPPTVPTLPGFGAPPGPDSPSPDYRSAGGRPTSLPVVMDTINENDPLETKSARAHSSSSSSSSPPPPMGDSAGGHEGALESDSGSGDLGLSKPKLFDMRLLTDSLDRDGWKQDVPAAHVGEALASLKATLEDYQGHYPELQRLEEIVHSLDRLLTGEESSVEGSARGSITIETALGAFDFLEQEYYQDGYGSANNSRRASLDQLEAQCTLSPESTTKTADSGIELIANRLSEDHVLDASFGSSPGGSSPGEGSPEPPSTGNEQVDTALISHLHYCDKLLENLGTFGPLKCKEIYSLDKLKRQAAILDKLLGLAAEGPQVRDLLPVMADMTRDKTLKTFWVRCVDDTPLYIGADRLLAHLERNYADAIRDAYDVTPVKVLRVFIARILDIPFFDPDAFRICPHVTMHQLMDFLVVEQSADIRTYLQKLAGEVWMIERLKSGSTDLVIKTLLMFQDVAPSSDCLRILSLLLITDNMEVRQAAAAYLKSLIHKPSERQKVLVTYVEALEDKNADVRCAACIALKLLAASESVKQLLYISQTDGSGIVKQKAKDALLSFGEESRKAYEESQLTSHGFQGINMRL